MNLSVEDNISKILKSNLTIKIGSLILMTTWPQTNMLCAYIQFQEFIGKNKKKR